MTDTALFSAYMALSIVFAAADIIIAILAFSHKEKLSYSFGFACIMAAVVDLSYMVSAVSASHFVFSLSSSIYFLAIDLMLVLLLEFCVAFVRYANQRSTQIVRNIVRFYAAFEIIVFAVNPFFEIAISYAPTGLTLPSFDYEMHLLYVLHLVYTYLIVVVVALLLIIKMLQVPKEYRMQYLLCIISIAVIIAINAVFLYIPLPGIISQLDLSVFAYTVGLALLYWSSLEYARHGQQDIFRSRLFETIMQGIVLFDYTDRIMMFNSRVRELLPSAALEEGKPFQEFLAACEMEQDLSANSGDLSFQCYVKRDDDFVFPVRCDHSLMVNKRGQKSGRMLVFTGNTNVEDLLTGFHSWDDFQRAAPLHTRTYEAPSTVAVVDINGLTMMNKTEGRAKGDQAIQELAGLMRKHFPKQTYFVRGQDANLIALTNTTSQTIISDCLAEIQAACSFNIIYAISSVGEKNSNVLTAIADALTGLKAKKLMDKDSIHSQLLTSLMRALEECDSDTEAHVKRTQKLGDMLGRRIGLSDVDRSQLSLLCMLHDIGKIGIPLEILNKPGKLSGPEWRTIQSHVEKGYQIALSVEELSGIADTIRYHHERWDGKGYPDGLKGENIPLLSRIISVVDAYDAMTNNRSYRRALSVSKAVAELKRCSGLQFDPYLVSEFLQIIPLTGSTDPEPEEEEDIVKPASAAMSDSQADSVHTVNFCSYIVDGDLHIINADEHFTEMTGYTLEEVSAQKMTQFDLIPPEDRAEYQRKVSEGTARGSSAYLEHRLLRKDGTVMYVFCYGKEFFDSVARAKHTEIVISNVSSTYSFRAIAAGAGRVPVAEHWDQASRRDALTALLNPEAFRSEVEHSMSLGGKKLLMLMADVDKFKEYNTIHGQRSGDNYLLSVSQALSGALRREDIASRVGGDEFAAVVFFDKEVDDEVINVRARQIYDKVCLTLTAIRGDSSLSMGAAVSGPELDSFAKLFEAADRALFSSKQTGRSKVTVYTPAK